ncbi:type IV pilus modification protein PilV [Ramlibacter sp. AW1]|uniref:Type IV pilus modification protein PilV n=1 Tax=Ramlibacter aurantiacus TaxID=2801330 RepID=A0A937D391_9BURK|nr:type IV pilus modification protein PilV [Ramlibacter aurantiacus]MBL0420485.1 type IV pilus modification protein PilV [Ramlibacter aurantiacus]
MLIRRSRARGVGLIELLVAIAVTSIGLLALVASHLSALRSVKQTHHASVATQLATDIVERMRANGGRDQAGDYVFTNSWSGQAQVPKTEPACATKAVTCSAAEIAADDLLQWRQSVRALLPEGSVYIEKDAIVTDVIRLWLAWRDPASASDEDVADTTDCAQLKASAGDGIQCLFLRVKL